MPGARDRAGAVRGRRRKEKPLRVGEGQLMLVRCLMGLCAISSDAPIHALRLPSSLVSSVHARPGQKVSALSNDGIAGTLVVVELTN